MHRDNERPQGVSSGTGSTQQRRSGSALDPGYAPVDGRSLPDLMVFATGFAKLLAYHEPDGHSADRDWSNFFAFDMSFLLAEICTVDLELESSQVLDLERQLTGEADGDLPLDSKALQKEALKAFYRATQRIDGWHRRTVKIAEWVNDGATIQVTLESVIKEDLRRHYQSSYSRQPWHNWLDDWAAEDNYEFGPLWAERTADEREPPASPVERLVSALNATNKASRPLVEMARSMLRDSLERPDHPPHTALYIAFLRLFDQVRADLNRFTGRHLDYYYRTVLKLRERDSQPDTAHLYFQLAKQVGDFELKAGTLLRGGKTADGKDILYAVDEDTWLNRTRVAALKTLYVAASSGGGSRRVTHILACPSAASEDGLGKPLKYPDSGWPTFGRDVAKRSQESAEALHARLGLMIVSPVLLLQEGGRKITLTFRFADADKLAAAIQAYRQAAEAAGYLNRKASPGDDPAGDQALLNDAFLLQFSGATGWVAVERFELRRRPSPGSDAMDLEFALKAVDPAVVECRRASHDFETNPARPGLRFLLNPAARVYAHSFFKSLVIAEVAVRVEVKGLAALRLQSGVGPIKGDQPFQPFGPRPLPGTALEIGHWELSQKPLAQVTLSIDWLNLPGDFEAYYRAYQRNIDNASFKARLLAKSEGRWQEVHREVFEAPGQTPFRLFEQAGEANQTLSPRRILSFDFPQALPVPTNAERGQSGDLPPPYALRLEFAEPLYGFGHEIYPQAVAEIARANLAAAIRAINAPKPPPDAGDAQPDAPGVPLLEPPNPPFVPWTQAVSVDYVAAERLALAQKPTPGTANSQRLRVFRVSPFGYSDGNQNVETLFTSYDGEGYLCIGLADLDPPQTVTLLFHLRDSFDPNQFDESPEDADPRDRVVRWHYLADNRWREFARPALVKDTTAGLMRSGIVKLRIPREINNGNVVMPAGLFWIQASVAEEAESRPRAVSIYTQAVTATRHADDPADISGGLLPPGTIKEFAKKMPAIVGVFQPFPTTGGRTKESTEQFRVRVSERLRHKRRAIQPGDYERIVLDAFPEVGQVKCIAWNNSQGYRTDPVPPGKIVLVAVPVRKQGDACHEPGLPQHVLSQIRDYLARYVSPFVRGIRVRNPVYERVKLFAGVRFAQGTEIGPGVRRLTAEVEGFLAPWRHAAGIPLEIGQGIGQGYRVQRFIENLPYVEQLTSLTLLQTYRLGDLYCGDYWPPEAGRKGLDRDAADQPILASAPWSVLVPADSHDFVVVDGDWDAEAAAKISPVGIGDLRVGDDLIVGG
ncbi:hypothetical protein [Methylomagnum sp.]